MGVRSRLLLLFAVLPGCAPNIPVTDVTVGAMVPGCLDRTDFELEDGSVADGYRLRLSAGQSVTVLVRGQGADRIDPYVFLFDEESQEELDHDDDSAGNFNSRLLFTAPAAASYGVVVTTYETASYRIRRSAPRDSDRRTRRPLRPSARALEACASSWPDAGRRAS
jgi:hypothetical protein